MQCPHDNRRLKLIEKNNAYGYHCIDCEGVFLHGKAISLFKHNYDTDILAKLVQQKSSQTSLKCPACHHELNVKTVDGIELDCCVHCSGIWFDSDELQQIIKKHGRKPTNRTTSILDAIMLLLGTISGGSS